METLRQRIGHIIRTKRIAAGFRRQGKFAEALGCDQPRVSMWESGKEIPDIRYREKLKALIGMTDSDFEPAIIRDNGEPNFEAAVERAAERVLSKTLSKDLSPDKQKLISAIAKIDDGLARQIFKMIEPLLSNETKNARRTR